MEGKKQKNRFEAKEIDSKLKKFLRERDPKSSNKKRNPRGPGPNKKSQKKERESQGAEITKEIFQETSSMSFWTGSRKAHTKAHCNKK